MISLECDNLFGTWREQARWLLSHQVDPSQVSWGEAEVADLFATDEAIPEGLGPFPGAHSQGADRAAGVGGLLSRRPALEPAV